MNQSPVKVYPGWSMGVERMSGAIAALDRMPVHGNWTSSPWSHVFRVFEWDNGLKLVAESLMGKGVRLSPFENLIESHKVQRMHIGEPYRLCQSRVEAMWQRFLALDGKRYDLRHIGGLLIWIASGQRERGERPAWLDHALNDVYICSELTAELDDAGGWDCHRGYSTAATTTPHSQWRAYIDEREWAIAPAGSFRLVTA